MKRMFWMLKKDSPQKTAIWVDPEIPFIIEQLQETASFDQMIEIVQKWLLSKLSNLEREHKFALYQLDAFIWKCGNHTEETK